MNKVSASLGFSKSFSGSTFSNSPLSFDNDWEAPAIPSFLTPANAANLLALSDLLIISCCTLCSLVLAIELNSLSNAAPYGPFIGCSSGFLILAAPVSPFNNPSCGGSDLSNEPPTDFSTSSPSCPEWTSSWPWMSTRKRLGRFLSVYISVTLTFLSGNRPFTSSSVIGLDLSKSRCNTPSP